MKKEARGPPRTGFTPVWTMCEFCGLHGAIHGDDKPLDAGFGFFSAAAIQSGSSSHLAGECGAVQLLARYSGRELTRRWRLRVNQPWTWQTNKRINKRIRERGNPSTATQ